MDEQRARTPTGPISVLICDDVEAIRGLLAELIDSHDGLRVAGSAENGEEAIAEAQRLQPDVILLDLSMPVLTGLDALPEIKLAAPRAKVIVLSGFAAEMIAEDALAHGADRFLEKGAHPDVITATIEEVVAESGLTVDA
jgi:DNA-binding NarL/FixJ family response regulator